VANDTGTPLNSLRDSRADASGVGQTGSLNRSTTTGGAGKVFREFKWGLLTLFLLMVVVIGLVYDGGKKKKASETPKLAEHDKTEINLDDAPAPPALQPPTPADITPRPTDARPAGYRNDMAEAGPGLGDVRPPAVHADPLPPARPATPEKTYVVKPGDTLSRIASTLLPGKGGLKAILDANKDVLPDPHRLKPSMTLKIPAAIPVVADKTDKTDKTDPRGALKAESTLADSKKEYTVQGGDTLERIARKLFNDGRKWREIYEWNRDQLSDPSRLREGQVLRIKQLADKPHSGAARTDAEESKADSSGKKVAETVSLPVLTDEPQVEIMNSSSAQFP
jgi:LysM repeat protein